MQGCAQPLINIGVRSLCKILHLLQNLDVLVLASILLSQDVGLSYQRLAYLDVKVKGQMWVWILLVACVHHVQDLIYINQYLVVSNWT